MSNKRCRSRFSSTRWTKRGSYFGRSSNERLRVDPVSHQSTPGAWQSGEIMKVLCQVPGLSPLTWAWSFTHLWPINTAWVNITVCSWNLCLTLVNWRENAQTRSIYFFQDFFSFKCFFAMTENTVHRSPLHRRFWRNAEEAVGLFMWDFAHGKYIWMWPYIHFGKPYTVAMPGVQRERKAECYKSLDKDCSHCQVSRPGQLNTEADPSTCAHPWDRALERQDGNRRGCQRVLFKVSSLWRLLIR